MMSIIWASVGGICRRVLDVDPLSIMLRIVHNILLVGRKLRQIGNLRLVCVIKCRVDRNVSGSSTGSFVIYFNCTMH